MEEEKKNTGQNLGIAALITAIITFVLAVIPCVGLIAIIPGIIAIILASVGLSQAARVNSPRGVLIAGLIIGILASLISVSQVLVAVKIASKADKWPTDINDFINDFKDRRGSIKIEVNGDTTRINVINSDKTDKSDQEKKLEDLEGGSTQKNDSVPKKK